MGPAACRPLRLAVARLLLAGGALVQAVAAGGIDSVVFTPGTVPLDTSGNEVHAHGGQITHHEGTYYWVGESEKLGEGDWLSKGVNLYASEDLGGWRFLGMILEGGQVSDVRTNATLRIERPKLLFNAPGQYWVLLFHLDDAAFSLTRVGLAKSSGPDPAGPYTYVRGFKPDGFDSFDMGVYQDDVDGRAYLIRSVENTFLGISQLRPDYLDTTGICQKLPRGEGPAVFRGEGGRPFVIASGLTGWAPNSPLLFAGNASSGAGAGGGGGGAPATLCGARWAPAARPAEGPRSNTTFDSQPMAVLPLRLADGTRLLVYLADRWNFAGPGSVGKASYVWLPLLPSPDGTGYMLKYLDRWSPGDFAASKVGEEAAAAEAAAPEGAVRPDGEAPSQARAGSAQRREAAWPRGGDRWPYWRTELGRVIARVFGQ